MLPLFTVTVKSVWARLVSAKAGTRILIPHRCWDCPKTLSFSFVAGRLPSPPHSFLLLMRSGDGRFAVFGQAIVHGFGEQSLQGGVEVEGELSHGFRGGRVDVNGHGLRAAAAWRDGGRGFGRRGALTGFRGLREGFVEWFSHAAVFVSVMGWD